MTKQYLILGPFSADAIDALQYDLILGLPSPTAVAGIGYNICLQLARKFNEEVVHAGTAVIVHDHSMTRGHERYVNSVYFENKSDARKPAASEDRFIARAKISLVISFEENYIDFLDMTKAAVVIAKGLSFSSSKLFPLATDEKLVRYAENDEVLKEYLKKSVPGFILTDRSELVAEELQLLKDISDKADVMDAFLNILEFTNKEFFEVKGENTKIKKKPTAKSTKKAKILKTETSRKYPGWLVPIFVGYQGLEPPTLRENTRMFGETLHTYAESLYSIGEYKSLYRLARTQGGDFMEKSFWKHEKNLDTATYFVKGF